MRKKKINFLDIIKVFEKYKVDYIIIGGIAVNIYGFTRMTGDLDLIISFSQKNKEKFIKAIKELGFVPRVPIKIEDLFKKKKREKWIKEKRAKVISFINPKIPFYQIDILIEKDIRNYKKRKAKFKDVEMWVISKDDLIRMKKEAGRNIDIVDIEFLKKEK